MVAKNPGHLRPELAQAQQKLETALSEACVADVKKADTAQLIRIDERLATASAAAKEAISIRQRLRREREQEGRGGRGGQVREIHRPFDDENGVRWDAFAVHPSGATAGRGALPDPYQKGWLSFTSAMETRRLAPIPEGWAELSDDGLRLLFEMAEIAPRRKY